MFLRLCTMTWAIALAAASPLQAQGVRERSVLTDRSLKETNPARESATKRAACSCPRADAPAIPCGACVDGMSCTGNNRTPVRNAC